MLELWEVEDCETNTDFLGPRSHSARRRGMAFSRSLVRTHKCTSFSRTPAVSGCRNTRWLANEPVGRPAGGRPCDADGGEFMKRKASRAAIWAYIGAILLVVSFSPSMDTLLDKYRLLHAIWHLALFIGAAFLVFGLESMRHLAKRHRHLTS